MMYERKDCANGMKMVVSPMPWMSSVSLGIWIGVGGRYESEKQSGISHLIEHMLFKGTASRSAKDLKQQVEGVGGAFNGFTSDEVTCYMVKVPEKYMERGIDILSDMVLEPLFSEEDIVKEKFVVCEEIKMYKDQPAEHVMDVLAKIMWPRSPLGRPLTGTKTTVKDITRKDMLDFKSRNYHAGNIAVIAAGKADPGKFFKYASERLAKAVSGKEVLVDGPGVPRKKASLEICRGKTNQAHIAMGFRADDSGSRERFALKVLNVVLGGNMSSRLFDRLRETKGLCYDISSSYKRHSDIGEVHIHAGVDRTKALESISGIVDELKQLKDSSVDPEELTRAKEFIKGQFLLAMEGTSTRMLWLGDRLLVHREIPELKDVLRSIDEVEPEEIKAVAGKVFNSLAANLAIVGNIKPEDSRKILKELNRL